MPYGVPVRGIVYFAAAALAMLVLGALPVFGELFGGMNTFTRLAIVPGAIAFVLYRLSLDGRPVARGGARLAAHADGVRGA